MSLFAVFDIAGSALGAQSLRLNVTASNMANANSASSSIEQTYRARHPVFSAVLDDTDFDQQVGAGVQVDGVVESHAKQRREYKPGQPLADADVIIFLQNVNVIEVLANMNSASRR
jgi:flagellar basal-body rod protein FlgC